MTEMVAWPGQLLPMKNMGRVAYRASRHGAERALCAGSIQFHRPANLQPLQALPLPPSVLAEAKDGQLLSRQVQPSTGAGQYGPAVSSSMTSRMKRRRGWDAREALSAGGSAAPGALRPDVFLWSFGNSESSMDGKTV